MTNILSSSNALLVKNRSPLPMGLCGSGLRLRSSGKTAERVGLHQPLHLMVRRNCDASTKNGLLVLDPITLVQMAVDWVSTAKPETRFEALVWWSKSQRVRLARKSQQPNNKIDDVMKKASHLEQVSLPVQSSIPIQGSTAVQCNTTYKENCCQLLPLVDHWLFPSPVGFALQTCWRSWESSKLFHTLNSRCRRTTTDLVFEVLNKPFLNFRP